MYNLFKSVTTNRAASFVFPMFTYVQDTLLRDVDKLIEFRRLNPKAIRSDHLLVKTLQSLNITFDGNIDIYRGYVEARTAQMSGGLGYTSHLYRGKPFYGRQAQFYGGKTVEIAIAADDDFDLRNARETWKDWQPVRILAHPRSDITIETLDASNRFTESGVCVIEVNIPMLACQYQLWKEEQQRLMVQIPRNTAHFVTMYPLTNAVYSHLDVSIFNRLSKRLYKEAVGKADRAVPFYTVDQSRRIDDVCDDIMARFTKTTLPWEDVLRNIPSLQGTSMLEVHRLPKMPRSNQVLWALIAARLNLVAFLVRLRAVTKDYKNVDEVTLIRRWLVDIESGKLLSNGLPSTLSTYFDKFITNRIEYYL